MSDYLEKSKNYTGYHYSVLEQEMIQYLHKRTLEMLKIIIPIFEENNIQYMICGGTLLGAVTTGKFIPWDDDVDICVMEQDYDRMIYVLSTQLPKSMKLQWSNTEQNYYHGWVKIRDKNSHVYPDISTYEYNGVWIDLYKLTLAEKKNVQYLIAKEHMDYLNRRYEVGDISLDERDKRIKDNDLLHRIESEHQKTEMSSDEGLTYIIWSASKILVDPEWCFPLETYSFEGMMLRSFKCPEQYLKRHYGNDYMILPPEEKRRVGINRIEFGESE